MSKSSVLKPVKLKIPPSEFIELKVPNYVNGERQYRNSDIPTIVTLDWMSGYLDLSKHTLGEYRKIAYKYVPAYRESATKRHPEYARKQVAYLKRKATSRYRPPTPDPPPFTHLEAVILAAIAKLFKIYKFQHGTERLVAAHIEAHPDFYENLENLYGQKNSNHS